MRKFPVKLLIAILVAVFFGIALYTRVALPYNQVFGNDWIKFTSNDAYYHMRLVDSLVHNFPRLISIDYYFLFPGVKGLGSIHFFDLLLAGIIWLVGLGSPTQHTIDVIGVYFPAVLGALAVVPVYFLGKELFSRWAGVISAGLMSVLPGEFLGRSILGFTDHHVAETLFTATAMLFLVLAIKTSRQNQLIFSHLLRRDWVLIRKPLIYSLLAGIFLGVYLITWGGALLFIFLIAIYLIIQFIIEHLRRQSSDYLCFVGVVIFLVALVIFAPSSPGSLFLVSLIIALLISPVLSVVSWLMTRRQIKPSYYPLGLIVIGLVALAIFYAVAPSLFKAMLSQFGIFSPSGASRTTLEMQPFLSPEGSFTLAVAWGNFTSGFYFSVAALLYLIFYKGLYRKHSSAEENLLLVWSLVILATTLAQRRFAYYFVVNVAVLTGYISWLVIWFAGLRKLVANPVEILEGLKGGGAKARLKKRQEVSPRFTVYHVNTVLAIIVVIFFVFSFNIKPTQVVAGQARYAPTDAWQSAMVWMKENTPEPFGDPDFYYKYYEPHPPGGKYEYPESAYGVMSWWDYGYWISRIAHRAPNVNPSQPPDQITKVAHFFLSQGESENRTIIQVMGSFYIVLDYSTTTSKIWAILNWAGERQSEFFEIYQLPYENKLVPVNIFYPEYYRTMCVRLYNFDGKSVTPENTVVISYEDKVSSKGEHYKQITSAREFTSYEEALSYVQSQNSANYKIVGSNPFVSPVPLEALKDYKLVYSSEDGVTQNDVGMVPEVKIFEYTGERVEVKG